MIVLYCFPIRIICVILLLEFVIKLFWHLVSLFPKPFPRGLFLFYVVKRNELSFRYWSTFSRSYLTERPNLIAGIPLFLIRSLRSLWTLMSSFFARFFSLIRFNVSSLQHKVVVIRTRLSRSFIRLCASSFFAGVVFTSMTLESPETSKGISTYVFIIP